MLAFSRSTLAVRIALLSGAIVVLIIAPGRAQQREWTSWTVAYGDDLGVEYRWRQLGMCTAVGCGKDIEYRNIGKSDVNANSVIWTKSMGSKDDEEQEHGKVYVRADSTAKYSTSRGADITRIVLRRP